MAALIAAARDLATSIGDYPDVATMARESRLNRLAPFSKAPWAFGLSFLLLLPGLVMTANTRTAIRVPGAALYFVGLARSRPESHSSYMASGSGFASATGARSQRCPKRSPGPAWLPVRWD